MPKWSKFVTQDTRLEVEFWLTCHSFSFSVNDTVVPVSSPTRRRRSQELVAWTSFRRGSQVHPRPRPSVPPSLRDGPGDSSVSGRETSFPEDTEVESDYDFMSPDTGSGESRAPIGVNPDRGRTCAPG